MATLRAHMTAKEESKEAQRAFADGHPLTLEGLGRAPGRAARVAGGVARSLGPQGESNVWEGECRHRKGCDVPCSL